MSRPFKLPQRDRILFEGIHEFFLEKKLGEGAFSFVYKAVHRESGNVYAIKAINFDKIGTLDQENIEKEIHAHKVLNHKNIVRLYDFFKESNMVYLVMEYCSGGNLFTYLNRNHPLSEEEIKRLFKQTVDGVGYTHKKGYINRDIKPENILLDKYNNVKICDFGWASHKNENSYRKLKAGTIPYMSPESLLGEYQEFSSDVWSLGTLLYELYNNKEPYNGMTCNSQLIRIRKGVLRYRNDNIPSTAKKLITDLMKFNKDDRMTIKEIYESTYLKDYLQKQRAKSIENYRKDTTHSISVRPYVKPLHGSYDEDAKSVSISSKKKSSYGSYFKDLAKTPSKIVRKKTCGISDGLPLKANDCKRPYINAKNTNRYQPPVDINIENIPKYKLRGAKVINEFYFYSPKEYIEHTSNECNSPVMSPIMSFKAKPEVTVTQSYQQVKRSDTFKSPRMNDSLVLAACKDSNFSHNKNTNINKKNRNLSSSFSYTGIDKKNDNRVVLGRVNNFKRAMTPLGKRPFNNSKNTGIEFLNKSSTPFKPVKTIERLRTSSYMDNFQRKKYGFNL